MSWRRLASRPPAPSVRRQAAARRGPPHARAEPMLGLRGVRGHLPARPVRPADARPARRPPTRGPRQARVRDHGSARRLRAAPLVREEAEGIIASVAAATALTCRRLHRRRYDRAAAPLTAEDLASDFFSFSTNDLTRPCGASRATTSRRLPAIHRGHASVSPPSSPSTSTVWAPWSPSVRRARSAERQPACVASTVATRSRSNHNVGVDYVLLPFRVPSPASRLAAPDGRDHVDMTA